MSLDSLFCLVPPPFVHCWHSLPCVNKRQFRSNFSSFGIRRLRWRYVFLVSACSGTQPTAFAIWKTCFYILQSYFLPSVKRGYCKNITLTCVSTGKSSCWSWNIKTQATWHHIFSMKLDNRKDSYINEIELVPNYLGCS